MAATDMKSHRTWFSAKSGARRVTKAMPMPESRKTTGKITGSASGARIRTATWAAANATKSPTGTASVPSERATLSFTM